MANIKDQISQARAAGYSDSDIAQHLSQKPEYSQKFKTALDAGYKPEEIISHLQGPTMQKSGADYGAVTNEMSTLDKINAGIGGALYGPYLGLKKFGANAANNIGLLSDKTNNEINSDVQDFKDAQSALNNTKAGMVGAALGSAVPGILLAPLSSTAGSGALIAGMYNYLTTPGDTKERLMASGTGAALGGLGGYAQQLANNNALLPKNITPSQPNELSRRLMQSAIKPNVKDLVSGDADIAINTLLEKGINPNVKGMVKIRGELNNLDDQITNAISSSNKNINKQDVLNALINVKDKFTNQVSPTSDLNAIQNVADDFAAHPRINGDQIPVQLAQDLKRGTYQIIGKKYGQLGSAETEAQKGLARGLKEQIANAVPEISGLNAEESKLIKTLNVVEKKALIDMNKNPVGLSILAHSPSAVASFMADRSSTFKALAARLINNAAQQTGAIKQSIPNALITDRFNPAISANYLYQLNQLNQEK